MAITKTNKSICGNCKFFVRYKNDMDYLGQCHRYAPHAPAIIGQMSVYWPITIESDWCGDFKMKEKTHNE